MNTFGLEMQVSYLGIEDKMFRWSVELRRGDRKYTVPYGAGFGHCKRGLALAGDVRERVTPEIARALKPWGKLTVADTEGYVLPTAPTLKSVLYCIQSDAQCGEHLLFEDFCSELGYDSDSRKAEGVWRACQKTRGELQKLLAEDFDAFMREDFDAPEEASQEA